MWPEISRGWFYPSVLEGLPVFEDRFNRLVNGDNYTRSQSLPRLNAWADKESVVLEFELPGVKVEDLDITVSGSSFTIKGDRKGYQLADGEQQLRSERRCGVFSRSLELPFKVDSGKVEAKYEEGILKVTLPRVEEDKPRKISINVKQ